MSLDIDGILVRLVTIPWPDIPSNNTAQSHLSFFFFDILNHLIAVIIESQVIVIECAWFYLLT